MFATILCSGLDRPGPTCGWRISAVVPAVAFILSVLPCGIAARRLGGVAGIDDPASFRQAGNFSRLKARDALLDHPDLIREFVRENPGEFREQELGLVLHWERFVRGNFIVERNLKNYTVFIEEKAPNRVFGVLGLSDEVVDLIPPLPAYVQAVLLPWKGAIVCDGLIGIFNFTFGGGLKKSLAAAYRNAKAKGIITSLDPGWQPTPAEPPKKSRTPKIQRFLKKCPKTVDEFKRMFGEPRLDLGAEAALEYSVWSVDGPPVLDIDYMMIYPNILRHQVLYVYAKNKHITHIAVVDPTVFQRYEFKPHPGWKLM